MRPEFLLLKFMRISCVVVQLLKGSSTSEDSARGRIELKRPEIYWDPGIYEHEMLLDEWLSELLIFN